jgi:hypothetical protein
MKLFREQAGWYKEFASIHGLEYLSKRYLPGNAPGDAWISTCEQYEEIRRYLRGMREVFFWVFLYATVSYYYILVKFITMLPLTTIGRGMADSLSLKYFWFFVFAWAAIIPIRYAFKVRVIARDLLGAWLFHRWTARNFKSDVMRLLEILGTGLTNLRGNGPEIESVVTPAHVAKRCWDHLVTKAIYVKTVESTHGDGAMMDGGKMMLNCDFEIFLRLGVIDRETTHEDIYASAIKKMSGSPITTH